MADPSVAAPAGVAMSGQDALLAAKLHVPGLQPGFVPRPRLVAALGEGLARGRVLVCAPAGFGKTALLADWAHGDGRPVAWLVLDDYHLVDSGPVPGRPGPPSAPAARPPPAGLALAGRAEQGEGLPWPGRPRSRGRSSLVPMCG